MNENKLVKDMTVAIAIGAVCAAAIWMSGCTRLSTEGEPVASGVRVTQVTPAAGTIEGQGSFRVEFSAPMEPSLLLSDVNTSQSVVLVHAADVTSAQAALARTHPTDAEAALFIAATAVVDPFASSITLTPVQPLGAGDFALVLSKKLADAQGRALEATAPIVYTVQATPPAPHLVTPLAGSSVPKNLERVRVEFPTGMPGQVVTLEGPNGTLAAAVAPDAAATIELELCASSPCARLVPGDKLSLAIAGVALDAEWFTVADCARDAAPSMAPTLTARDVSISTQVLLDWPAQVMLELAPDDDSQPQTLDDGTFDRLCDRGACLIAQGTARCASTACSALPASCAATLSLDGLTPGTNWVARVTAQDDEGHRVSTPLQGISTLQALPGVVLSELMASPPGPEPKSDGEYVELWNPGPGAADVTNLALVDASGVPHAILGTPPPQPVILQPGARALVVGQSFDSRYPIPEGTPILRASTKRLLVYGLADSLPSLVLAQDTAQGLTEVSRYPGGGPKCGPGLSLERSSADPLSTWRCGVFGGSPGRAP
ncbi:MAG: lamin tail domain-containing protein [Deltaproteobacteria bacterium]|nr:lamin tail domain-containing protein [Deltaproteobacteria bacterium]